LVVSLASDKRNGSGRNGPYTFLRIKVNNNVNYQPEFHLKTRFQLLPRPVFPAARPLPEGRKKPAAGMIRRPVVP
jgi:hypothetical protein